MKKAYLECGKIINIHGFRGTVKTESWCDRPEILAHLPRVWFAKNGEYLPRAVRSGSVFKQFVLLDIEGVESEEAANALRGEVFYAAREDLPLGEGEWFLSEVIGLPVRHADTGEELGKLTDVITGGVRNLCVIRNDLGEHLVPAVPQFLVRVDPDDAVYLRPIPGLLDGEAEQV